MYGCVCVGVGVGGWGGGPMEGQREGGWTQGSPHVGERECLSPLVYNTGIYGSVRSMLVQACCPAASLVCSRLNNKQLFEENNSGEVISNPGD